MTFARHITGYNTEYCMIKQYRRWSKFKALSLVTKAHDTAHVIVKLSGDIEIY